MSETAGQRPLLLRIVDDLRERIDSGDLGPGARLPSTRELIESYGVSTQTVQRAISVLRSEGVVESIPGKGVFVRSALSLQTRAASAMEVDPHLGATDIVARCALAPDDVAGVLGAGAGQKIVAQESLLNEDREYVEILTSYYSPVVADPTKPLEEVVPEDGSIAELKRLGFAPHHVTELVQTRMPTPREARILRLPPGVAVFRVLRSVVAADGQVLEVQTSVLSGDRYQLLYELPIHD